jgi:predicted O-methyltransferase YrrM
LQYQLFARHKYGFGIHSPFVFDLVTGVFRNNDYFEKLHSIEKLRKELLQSGESINFSDFGSGSKRLNSTRRKIKDIVKYSSIPVKYGKLLYRLVDYFKPNLIIELGTSLGISTLYLASASHSPDVYTIEGCPGSARIATNNFKKINARKIYLKVGRFDDILPLLLKDLSIVDLMFFDGDHREDSTMRYFYEVLPYTHNDSIFVFDDIHLSKEMQSAWKKIKQNCKVQVTIDLFRFGLVFFKKEMQKQDFVIRF